MDIEERTVTLKVTKERLTKEQAKKEIRKRQTFSKRLFSSIKSFFLFVTGMSALTQPDECSDWFIEIRGGHTYTCRICYTQGPTGYPYKECIQLPDN